MAFENKVPVRDRSCPVNVWNEKVHHYQAPAEGNVNKDNFLFFIFSGDQVNSSAGTKAFCQ